ncbi:cupin domain-containing protein [Kibdelosporangium philippinense]|uniref:Cupin domain-containing protein n=1 Tax=Kibdelosporangium philippinense TaxID=211113 RepID=A0ABS8Z420_9PSEU|nr:cupin domain-containing protein [Kibdelosporangium philippinense]MCE7002676.1 cupin domain-containing protein [Kibdelosporangium philippinense]
MRLAALAGAVLTTVALSATAANATPSSGVTGTIISETTVAGKDIIVREITIAPGGTTGWHHHDGTLYAYVRSGTLTHNKSDCSIDGIYHAGDALIEQAGADNVHVGRNLGTTPMVLDVVYVLPAGAPLAVDEPNPGCDFQ